MIKQDFHVFQGMKQDISPLRQESKYLRNALNIRFTDRENNTLFSMSNERGTKDLNITLEGAYIGHCTIGNYIVVFTEKQIDSTSTTNCIYRIECKEDSWASVKLYEAPLNMNAEHPIQSLGVYEGDLVQKVYWVDGKNQPRVINVVADKLQYDKDITELTSEQKESLYIEGCFDFVQQLVLNERIKVTRKEGGGSFSSGTIQYAFSYYNKYGQESNIFYTTELLNISYTNRGGSPEDNINNAFFISLEKVDTRFQYLRVYSIHRTSLDVVPTVKIVTDIELSTDKLSYSFTDNGLIGDTIDPTRLLYIGGEPIKANTIKDKDNTLFLGGIELSRKTVSDTVREELKTLVANKQVSLYKYYKALSVTNDSESIYNYSNQLAVGNTASFKVGETYRLGIQFQHITGKWSEPFWVGDYTIEDNSINRPNVIDDSSLQLTGLQLSLANLTTSSYEELLALGYRKVRPLIVQSSIYDRTILAQGILCPTVFSIKDRVTGTPFAQSSWFFRPMSSLAVDNTTNIDKGSILPFKHLDSLLGEGDRGAEIQNMTVVDFATANTNIKEDKEDATSLNTFYIDQSIVTFHSPDVEFDTSTQQALEGNEYNLKIVGIVPFKSNVSDISIQTSSPVPAPNDTGFYHKSFLTLDYSNRIMASGLFYKSHIIDESSNAEVYSPYNYKDYRWELNWLVYPWQRTGSLNNDTVRPEGKGTSSSVLKRKVISNLRYSPSTIWATTPWDSSTSDFKGITPVSIFNSNEVSLIKIPIPDNSNINTINYYGNVDSLITTNKNYTFYCSPNTGENIFKMEVTKDAFIQYPLQKVSDAYKQFIGDYAPQLRETKDPVRMKYKSSPHAVFAFNYQSNHSPVILPTINGNINKKDIKDIPFWSNISAESVTISISCQVEYHGYYSGSPEEIEGTIITVLNKRSDKEANALAICTCSRYPSKNNFADLYTYNGNSWAKKVLSKDNDGEIYTYSGSYWKVVYITNIGARVLCKITTTDQVKTYKVAQGNIKISNEDIPTNGLNSFLYIAELLRKEAPVNRFGGDTEEALRNNIWIPAGESIPLESDAQVLYTYGDTYYQRYDCLKTYAFTTEDENSVIDIASFMCETRTNIDGRYDRNRGQISNLNVSPSNFNLLNNVYSQKDNFFNYRILDRKYYKNTKYANQIVWSQEKTYLDDIDIWTNVTLANSIDLGGNYGNLTTLETFNNSLLAFQDRAMSQVLFNSRVQIPTSDGVPVEISNNYKVDGYRIISDTIGCQDKAAIVKSPLGIYFLDNNTNTLYLYNEGIQDISSQLGEKSWFINHHVKDNWTIKNSNSVRLGYDPNNKDLYIIPKSTDFNGNTLCYSEQLGQFTSLMSYDNVIMLPIKDKFISMSYDKAVGMRMWENFKGNYNSFFGETIYPNFTYICNEDAAYTKIFDTIEYRADLYDSDNNLLHKESFDWIQAYNEYQDSREKTLSQSRRVINDISLRKKFRVWRGQIPRDNRERMRNLWTAITLGFKHKNGRADDFHFVLHDISTKYTV